MSAGEPPHDRVRAELRVRGRVQGVFFRASARDEARRLGLAGEVRNLPSGEVEVIAEGERGLVEQLIAWCRRGPPAARVEDVQARFAAPEGKFRSFEVAR